VRTQGIRLAVVVGLLAGGLAAIGQEPEKTGAPLRWRFKPGEVVHYVMTQETSNASRPEGGQAMTNTMSQTVDLRWKVESVSPEGVAKLTQTIDRVRAKIANQDQPAPFMFDSQGAPADETDPFAARVVPLLKALAGAEFHFSMTPQGEIDDVAISDKLREALLKANPAAGESAVSPEALKGLIAQATLVLPREGAAAGKSWTRETKVPLPAVGEMVMTKTFTDQGPESAGSPIHKIDLKTEVSHQSAEGSPLEMKISGQKGTGLYKFDAQAGRVVSARVEDSMTMSLSAGGRRIEQTTSNTITTELAPAADSSGK